MRHKVVVAVGFVSFGLLMVACGGTPQPTPAPTADIEATVETRVAEERADVNVPAMIST